MSRLPLVAVVHHLRSSEAHPDWLNRIYRQVESLYLASIDGFIFNSYTTRKVVGDLTGWKDEPAPPGVVAFPAGDRFVSRIEPQGILQRAQQPGPLRMLFLGNLTSRKGLHTLLGALKSVSQRTPGADWTLDVAGSLDMDPAYTQKVRQLVKDEGFSQRVYLRGSLENGSLETQLRASHLLVVPSQYEGFGIAYLEGMGFGLPAIATTGGAAGEIVHDGVDGFLVPPGDVGVLAERLHLLICQDVDRSLLASLSLAALSRFQEHPGWEQTTRKIREFLLELVEAWR